MLELRSIMKGQHNLILEQQKMINKQDIKIVKVNLEATAHPTQVSTKGLEHLRE
jgi:hypothetical protein